MKFENDQVMNFEGALRGMRAPMASWAKSDSIFDIYCEHEGYGSECIDEVANRWAEYLLKDQFFEEDTDYDNEFAKIVEEKREWLWRQGANFIGTDHHYTLDLIGPNDMDLARRLITGGTEHRKFLRQIFVSVDITAPLYWWKEADTYQVGVTKNSTSTMHKLASTPITLDCFETDDFDRQALVEVQAEDVPNHIVYDFIEWMETCRQKYNETKDKRYWKELVRWLPNGWLQTRTVTMNYENLRAMYHQREHHKLSEWHQFCEWVAELPYAKELIID